MEGRSEKRWSNVAYSDKTGDGCIWCKVAVGEWVPHPCLQSNISYTATTHLTCASALPCLILSANVHTTNNTTSTARASPAPTLSNLSFNLFVKVNAYQPSPPHSPTKYLSAQILSIFSDPNLLFKKLLQQII